MLTQKMNVKPLLKIFVQSKQSINGVLKNTKMQLGILIFQF